MDREAEYSKRFHVPPTYPMGSLVQVTNRTPSPKVVPRKLGCQLDLEQRDGLEMQLRSCPRARGMVLKVISAFAAKATMPTIVNDRHGRGLLFTDRVGTDFSGGLAIVVRRFAVCVRLLGGMRLGMGVEQLFEADACVDLRGIQFGVA